MIGSITLTNVKVAASSAVGQRVTRRCLSASMSEEIVYANDTRVTGYEQLMSPQELMRELPVSETSKATIARARHDAARVINGEDDRLLVIVGPCSIHDLSLIHI